MPARRPDVPRYAPSYRRWSPLFLGALLLTASAGAAATLLAPARGAHGDHGAPAPNAPAPLASLRAEGRAEARDAAAAGSVGTRPLVTEASDGEPAGVRASALSLPTGQGRGLLPAALQVAPQAAPAGAAGGSTDPQPVAGAPVDVPLLVHQALPAGTTGIDHPDSVVTFGLPFERGAVPMVNGRPALGIQGSDVWQFQSLSEWDDGTVRWALADARVDVAKGEIVEDLEVVGGAGASHAYDLAWQGNGALRANTGPLRLWIPQQLGLLPLPLLFVQSDHAPGFAAPAPLWLVGRDVNLGPLGAGPGTRATLVQNGPARSLVRIDGPVIDASGDTVLEFSALVTLRAGRGDIEVSLTVRNASIDRMQHAQIESLGLALDAYVGSDAVASIAGPDDPYLVDLAPGQFAYSYQAHSSASTIHTDSPDYLPHLPKKPGSQHEYVHEGYKVHAKGVNLLSLGDRDAYPAHGWIDVTGAAAGVTASIQRMPYLWPAALEVTGGGLIVAGLFTARNPADYTFLWRQHESRTALFSFHDGGAQAPGVTEMAAVAERLDHPIAARAADYKHYDRAEVFPYRLLSIEEHEQTYLWMGFDHQLQVKNDPMTVMRYIGKSFTGGVNNYALIEDRLGARWLRHGLGGHFLKGLDYALWKSEWQIKRSDDFVHVDGLEPTNDSLPHTTRTFGDEEHRYREGIMLAYWLTGDPRFRDAIFDEAEILKTITNYQQERSMYQTLRAQALVAEFTQDAGLRDVLADRIDWFCNPTIDILLEDEGWGWEAAPDLGARRYFVNSADNKNEKPPGENYQTRGWITASLGPLGLYHASRAFDAGHPSGDLARGRMRDLSFWTRQELFPFVPDPNQRHLPYSYAVTLMDWTITEIYDFHPILMGMAESYLDTRDLTYLKRGVQQIEAFAAHDNGPYTTNLYLTDTRMDCQHFFAVYREWFLEQL